MGVGAAMTGLRPVIEGMNMGLLLPKCLTTVACYTTHNSNRNPRAGAEAGIIFPVEYKWLPAQLHTMPKERRIPDSSEHVTILTYSRMRYHVMQAAKTLVKILRSSTLGH